MENAGFNPVHLNSSNYTPLSRLIPTGSGHRASPRDPGSHSQAVLVLYLLTGVSHYGIKIHIPQLLIGKG